MLKYIPLMKTSEKEFADLWAQVCRDGQREHDAWIARLRSQGVKAAHPNDGWVDRVQNIVVFAYPQFNDGANVGDIIVLGWPSRPDKTVYARVTEIFVSIFSIKNYRFEKISPPNSLDKE